jgi:hypothetical protein
MNAEFWGREFGEQEILESLLRKEPFNIYAVDEEKGIVYARNDSFETGVGRLFEPLGRIRPEIIAANKSKMNRDVLFINAQNREEMLEQISWGWSPAMPSETLKRYL